MNETVNRILDLLKFAPRQKTAFYDIFIVTGEFLKNFSVKKLIAVITLIGELLGCILFDSPVTPHGEALDLTGYNIVFSDNFNGDSLNSDVWFHRGEGPRRTGFNSESQVSVEGGNLILRGEYLKNGAYGAGWYVAAVALKQKYNKGYYEIRCKCNGGDEFWSAFWIQADHPYDHDVSKGGPGGAEIDIFESIGESNGKKGEYGTVTSTVHCNGFDDDPDNIDSNMVGKFKVKGDISKEYNTFGLKWTDDEYIFYINGVESERTSFGSGVSKVPEEVIVSLEIPDSVTYPEDYKTEMAVDYVRIYQQG